MNLDEVKKHLKNFINNKNTITFILVIVCIVVIYFAYNYLVNRAIRPVSIPYANTLIKSGTKVTSDMLSTVNISGSFVTSSGSNLLQYRNRILNKYVRSGYEIPAYSFFYNEALSDTIETNKNEINNLPDGYYLFMLPVDFHTTYGCSMMPGNYIDLYFKATDDTTAHNIIYELFIKSIQILKVVDRNGLDVFTNTDEGKQPTPKYIYFAVPQDYFELLGTALEIPTNNIEIVPVPRNAGYSENPEPTSIVNQGIVDFINAKKVYITY